MLMNRSNDNRQPILPSIHSFRTQPKPIKDILKDLKQRKVVIQSRIKTQMQSDIDDRDEVQNQLKQRVITEIPIYTANKTNYLEKYSSFGSREYHHIKSEPKINEIYEQQDSQARNSKIKSEHPHKRNSILQPIVDIERGHSSPKTRKQILKQVQQLFVNIPVDPRDRTQSSIQQLKQYLMNNNMFFSKIHSVIATCLLKLNRLMWLQKNQTLYRIGEERSSIYIILCGRLKIYDGEKNLKKICNAGQSVAQQLLFCPKIKKAVMQSAKAVSRCFLVQIKIENYKKMGQEMMKYGYKVIFNEMESIIKRNYITKNWLRGEKDRYQKRH